MKSRPQNKTMEVFQYLKKVLKVFGLFESSDCIGSINAVPIMLNIIVLASSLSLLVPAVAFIAFDATNTDDIFATLFGIGGSLIVCVGYTVMLCRKSAMNKLITALEKQMGRRTYATISMCIFCMIQFYSSGETEHDYSIYTRANDLIERFSKCFVIILNLGVAIAYVMPFINVAVDLRNGQYSNGSWHLIYNAR